jgi:hypothetical protein
LILLYPYGKLSLSFWHFFLHWWVLSIWEITSVSVLLSTWDCFFVSSKQRIRCLYLQIAIPLRWKLIAERKTVLILYLFISLDRSSEDIFLVTRTSNAIGWEEAGLCTVLHWRVAETVVASPDGRNLFIEKFPLQHTALKILLYLFCMLKIRIHRRLYYDEMTYY